MIPHQEIIPFYYQVLKYLQPDGKKIYIKKHPNDIDVEFEKEILRIYSNVKFITEKTGAEGIAATYKPGCLAGGISTSAFTIPFIFQIKSYNYALLYKKFTLDRVYLQRINMFYNYFKNSKEFIRFLGE
jgi:hypothetical protein